MNAILESLRQRTRKLADDVVRPFSGACKIFVTGSRDDLRVPMREISQQSTSSSIGLEKNPPLSVYDTSGPYTDPDARIDLVGGLPALRSSWIDERHDCEQLDRLSSEYGQRRLADEKLLAIRFPETRNRDRIDALGRVRDKIEHSDQHAVV